MIAIIIGAVAGGIVGFLYYRFIGCRSGACIITGNPYISTIYGAVLGGLVANLLK
jgi:outer membrane lipoprotein SlyB